MESSWGFSLSVPESPQVFSVTDPHSHLPTFSTFVNLARLNEWRDV